MRYPTKQLGEVCDIVNGGTPKTNTKKYWNGDVLWTTPKDMGKLKSIYSKDTSRKITREGLKKSSAKLIPKRSIILSSRAPIGYLLINTEEMSFNQGCKGLISKKGLENKYLYYFLYKSVNLLNKLGSGTTFKEISSTKIKEIQIPLPPLPEQKRIVGILDEVFEDIGKAKENAEKNLQNSKELFESYLQSVFENPGKGWEEKKLGELLEIERGGSPRPIQKYLTSNPNGINWIKIGDTKNVNKYIESTRQKIKPEGLKKTRLVNEGDFILSNSMSFGRPYIMKTTGAIHDGWLVLREKNKNIIDKNYLYNILGSNYVFNQFDKLAAGSTVRNLNIALVSGVAILLPSIEIQKQIVKKLDSLSAETKKLEEIYQQKIDDLEELKKSVLKKAFSGEL